MRQTSFSLSGIACFLVAAFLFSGVSLPLVSYLSVPHNMVAQGNKTFIIHTTSQDPGGLLKRLYEHPPFRTHYDGNEHTIKVGVGTISTRYYFYHIPHAVLCGMVRHLQTVREGFTGVKVCIKPYIEGGRFENMHAFD